MIKPAFIEKHFVLLISLLLFLTNFILKILFISSNEIAMDEPFSIFYAQMDLPSIYAMLKAENNPPLHFILLHYWVKAFGIGPFSVRFLSVLFSSLTASVVFLTGKKFFSTRTGLVAALIFTFSQFHVFYSHEARVYPLFVFLTALSLYFFLVIVNAPRAWRSYSALLVVNTLLVYAHYFGFFVLATEVICIFFSGNVRVMWKKMLGVFIVLLLFYIPNALIFLDRLSVSIEYGTWVRKPVITEIYGNLNRFLNSRTVMMVFLLIVVIYLILLLWHHRLFDRISHFFSSSSSRILLIWFVFPYLSMFIISFWVPMFLDRYILFTSIGFYLLIAVFLATFSENRIIRLAGTVSLLLSMIFNLTLAPDNNRRVSQLVNVVTGMQNVDSNSIVILSPEYSSLEFSYHYNINYFKDYKNTISHLNNENIFPLRDFSEFDQSVLSGKNVIFADCGVDFAFGKNRILSELDSTHLRLKSVPVFEIYKVYWYGSRAKSGMKGIPPDPKTHRF